MAFGWLGYGAGKPVGGAAVLGTVGTVPGRATRWGECGRSAWRTGMPRELLRGRGVCALAGRSPAPRSGMGTCCRRRGVHGNFLEDQNFHPAPAGHDALAQMFGDVWEWTASPYVAIPGSGPPWARSVNTTANLCQSIGIAWRFLRHSSLAHARHLPQLLSAAIALAIYGHTVG